MEGSSQPTLSGLVAGFLFALQADGRAPPTLRYYRENLRRFLWYVNQKGWPDDPQALDAWKIRDFLGYAATTHNRWGTTGNGSENCLKPPKTNGWRYYRCLRTFLKWAEAEHALGHNPMANVKMRQPKEQPVEPYSLEDLKKLSAVCDPDFERGDRFLGSRHKAMLLLFVATGMRLSELGNLRLQDISIEQGRAAVVGNLAKPAPNCFSESGGAIGSLLRKLFRIFELHNLPLCKITTLFGLKRLICLSSPVSPRAIIAKGIMFFGMPSNFCIFCYFCFS